ncbi:hypothetical protein BCR32DRAFT_324188, partial [Anaeromyces robustus]
MLGKDFQEKSKQKYPKRISSKVPVNITIHTRNNSIENSHEYSFAKPISMKSFSNKIDNTYSSSYHSYFALGQTPSNASSSSSNTTQRSYPNYNNNDDTYRVRKDINKDKDDDIMDESVTLSILNSKDYAKKLIRASRDSFEFDYEKDYKKKEDNEYNNNNNSKNTTDDNIFNNNKYIVSELVFSPEESPIVIPGKPSNNKVDMSRSVLFKHSNSSSESLSSTGSKSGPKKRVSLKKARNSINLTRKRSSSIGNMTRNRSNSASVGSRKMSTSNQELEDFPFYKNNNNKSNSLDDHSKNRSLSLPRRIEIRDVRNNSNNGSNNKVEKRNRSNTLPRSMILSPVKDEKFSYTLPKKEFYSVQDLPIPRVVGYDIRNNFDPIDYDNDKDKDKDDFIYNQDLISPTVSEYVEYRTLLKSNNLDLNALDEREERRYRSLSRKSERNERGDKGESRYRSLSRSRDENKRSSRSRSRSRQRGREHNSSPSNNVDGESRYRSLSRTKNESKDDREREYERKDSNRDRSNYEHRRSESKDKIYYERRKSESRGRDRGDRGDRGDRDHSRGRERSRGRGREHDHEKRRSSSRHKKSNSCCHKRNKSLSESPLPKNSQIIINNNRGSPLSKATNTSHNGSPLAINTNVINNKFSTSYIQNDYNNNNNSMNKSYIDEKNTSNNKYMDKSVQKISSTFNNSNSFINKPFGSIDNDDSINRINNSKINDSRSKRQSTTVGESKNTEILNEIHDLKKFSQDFSGLKILEDILNKPLEEDIDFTRSNRRIYQNSNPTYPKFSTISRLPSHNRNGSYDYKRRNSDTNYPFDFQKGHNRVNSDQSRNMRNEDNNKNSRKNIFNFFSNHKKSRSSSSINFDNDNSKMKVSDFDKMIKGNDTIKIKLQPSNKICTTPYLKSSPEDSFVNDDVFADINNKDYEASFKSFLNDKKKNNKKSGYNQPISNIKDYTPLFRINMTNNNMGKQKYNDDFMEQYGGYNSKNESNPFNQFNGFDHENDNRKSSKGYNKYG